MAGLRAPITITSYFAAPFDHVVRGFSLTLKQGASQIHRQVYDDCKNRKAHLVALFSLSNLKTSSQKLELLLLFFLRRPFHNLPLPQGQDSAKHLRKKTSGNGRKPVHELFMTDNLAL